MPRAGSVITGAVCAWACVYTRPASPTRRWNLRNENNKNSRDGIPRFCAPYRCARGFRGHTGGSVGGTRDGPDRDGVDGGIATADRQVDSL
jgi:hypothetical protein